MRAPDTLDPSPLPSVKLFLALSRTTHGIVDLATPALAAVLWLGTLPPVWVALVGLVTAFAGYTAIYALNDLVDCRTDRERIRRAVLRDSSEYLDTVYVRHPVAQGLLSVRMGLAWVVFWSCVALAGTLILNPVCALFFVAGAVLEAAYCRMLEVTHLRVFVSGVVKTLGGLAAVFAVDPAPSPVFLSFLFLWLFLWEIGGQNVPADLFDLEEDAELRFRTVPVRFGTGGAARIILGTLYATLAASLLLLAASPNGFSPWLGGACILAGIVLLIVPAHNFSRRKTREAAGTLFARASFYPLSLLAIVLVHMVFEGIWR